MSRKESKSGEKDAVLALLAPSLRPLELPRVPVHLEAALPALAAAEPEDTPVPTDEAYPGTGGDVVPAE